MALLGGLTIFASPLSIPPSVPPHSQHIYAHIHAVLKLLGLYNKLGNGLIRADTRRALNGRGLPENDRQQNAKMPREACARAYEI